MSATGRGLALAGALLVPTSLAGAESAVVLDEAAVLRISQAAIGSQVENLSLRDVDGGAVALADFRGRPLIVNLVYTACSTVCPVVVQTLHDAVLAAQETLGPDSFAVLTIGFDAVHDTPQRMRAFARERGIDLPGWRFLSADQPTIDRLAEQLGFVIVPGAGAFEHLAQTTIVDQDGVVYRQIYGGGFEVPTLVEPLKELVLGRRSAWTSIDGLIARVKLFCTLYDPKSGRYRVDYSPFVAIAIGLVCLGGVGAFVVREWRRSGGPAARA